MNWNEKALASIRKQKTEIAKRYGIRFGQTQIYCLKCTKLVSDPLSHICHVPRRKSRCDASCEATGANEG